MIEPNPHAYAVVLAGGHGERFWPASTMARPKQLLDLLGERTMLEMAVDRLEGLIPPERVIVITGADLVAATVDRSPDLPAGNIIGEPFRRDTAAAVALACAVVRARDPEGVFCVVTADHVMGDLDRFRETLHEALSLAASENVLITIGIAPTHPATGYGYIENGDELATEGSVCFRRVERFVEKPDATTAGEYLDSGRFSWNSGMFIWSVEALRRAFAAHTPALGEFIDDLTPFVDTDGFEQALADRFESLEKISIDYALMEHADNIVMAEGTFAWSDVGDWNGVADHLPRDKAGNAVVGAVETFDAHDNVVVSYGDDGRLTAIIGASDLVVVQTAEVTLICPKDRAQDVKALVTQLRDRGRTDLL